MAILGVISTVSSVASTLGSIFGGGLDDERKANIDAIYSRALAGDAAAKVRLQCLSGDQSSRPEAIRLGLLSADEISRGTPCGAATDAARKYARDMLTALQTRQVVANVAGNVATGATQVGVEADPGTYLATVGSNVGGAMGIPSWVLWAIGAAGVVWLVRKR